MNDLDSRIRAAKVRLNIRGDDFTESDVRKAAALKMKQYHPDTADAAIARDSGTLLAKVKADRALLIKFAMPTQPGNKCPHCEGTGYVRD